MNDAPARLARPLVSGADDVASEFEARLSESSRLAVRVAYGVLRNQADAEDVAQEAFVRAHRAFASLRDRQKFRAWLVRMTWRLALDHRRGARRRSAREQAVAVVPEIESHERDLVAAERVAALWRAIDALPEKLRVVVVLASIEEQRVRDVAALLDLPEGTVKSRLFDARRLLQEWLA
jgi:RNA polymerase sigma-70 factor (ECF subfamily)